MISGDKFGKLCKDRMSEELMASLEEHPDFVITSYMGSTVAELEQLRKNLNKTSARYIVVKNSILRNVFEKLKLDAEVSKIEGGVGLGLSGSDIILTCKELVAFAKRCERFKIKGAVIDKRSISEERIKQLAAIPSKEALLAHLLGGMKSPITGLVNTLNGLLRKFVCVVDAIKSSKETHAGTP